MKWLCFGAVALLHKFLYAVHAPPMLNPESSLFFHCLYVALAHFVAIQTKTIYIYSAHYIEALTQSTETSHTIQEGLFLGLGSTFIIWLPAEISHYTYTGISPNLLHKSLFYFWSFQILYNFLSKLHIPRDILIAYYNDYSNTLLLNP